MKLMESLGSEAFDLDLGRRLFVIVVFLVCMWYVLNYFANRVKEGSMQLPEFLKRKFPSLKSLEQGSGADLYKMNIIQRKIQPDGSEFMVMDVNGRHILLSRHPQSGINYITDLKEESRV